MSDTSGPTSGTPLAQYDREQRCWKTSEVTSLWALPMSSLTLPTWGCLRDGELYELLTPQRHTIERGYSSLPTPRAQARDVIYNRADYRYNLEEALAKLPTPRAQNGELRNQTIYRRPGVSGPTGSRLNLENALALLPTPQAGDGFAQNDNLNNKRAHKKSPYQELPRTVAQELLGAHTAPPLSDGQPSLDDLLQPLPFDETTATD